MANNQPIKVSIITPSYNQGNYIEATIQSVLNQTYKNIEYIIIDGNSTDNTMDVVNKYKDKIDIIIHERDKGQTDAINKGFKLATGDLVGWINSDDILYPDCIEQIVSLYNQAATSPAIIYCSLIDIIDGEGKYVRTKQALISGRDSLLNQNYDVIQQGSFYNRDFVREVNYLDETLHYCMDLDLWLKLLGKGGIISYDEKALAAFRFWETTKTVTGGAKFIKEIEKTIVKYGARTISNNRRRIFYYKSIFTIKRILNK